MRRIRPGRDDEVALDRTRGVGGAGRRSRSLHVGQHMWRQLGPDELLAEAGIPRKAVKLTEVMVLDRLIAPASQQAMVEWTKRTAVAEVVGIDLARLNDKALYRDLDWLDTNRATIGGRPGGAGARACQPR